LIFHEHNIRVMPVSSSGTAVISMNVIGGQLDEANFLQKTIHSKSQNADESGGFDQAKLLYNTLAARRKSRFTHRQGLPGALYLISSSRFPDDFTELKAQEAEMYGGKDKRIYVFEGSQWSIKGRDKFRAEEFQVQIGNESFPSRVLTNGAVANPGCQVINVPMDFLEDFERDTEGSIRDLAGLTTLATHPFITQRHKIAEAMELATDKGYLNPLGLEQVCFADGLPKPNLHRLRTDVDAPRHAHIDLGISKDACGIAIGHIAGHMVKETVNEETGKRDTEITPVVAYDIVLRVVPPLGGEIQLEDVRTFLNRLKKIYGLNIKTVTFDGFQSVDSRQLLRKQGFMADYLSVEKPEPWRSFRDALYDGRILLFRHNWVSKELAEVETTLTQARKEKIDHRPNGTKDVADAVVGVAAYLLSRRVSWRSVQYDGGATGMFLLGDRAMKEIMANGMGRPNKGTIEETGRRSIQRRPIARRSMR
jgi:hypothetical protein